MWNSCKQYFRNRKYEYHGFRIIGFSKKDYTTYKTVSVSKIRSSDNWFFNNLYFPVMVIISPVLLIAIHYFFNTIAYNRSLLDILITGSLTLLGINVLRTASTTMSEKVDLPDKRSADISKYEKLILEVDDIRSKLDRRTWVLTLIGWLVYFSQVGQFVTNSHSVIYIFVIGVILLTFVSIIYGRFIFIMKTNVLGNDEVAKALFGSLPNQSNDYDELKNRLNKQGVL